MTTAERGIATTAGVSVLEPKMSKAASSGAVVADCRLNRRRLRASDARDG